MYDVSIYPHFSSIRKETRWSENEMQLLSIKLHRLLLYDYTQWLHMLMVIERESHKSFTTRIAQHNAM